MGLRRHEYGDAHAVAVDTGIRHVATNLHTVFHSALSSVPRLHSDLLVFHPLRGNVHIPIKPSLELSRFGCEDTAIRLLGRIGFTSHLADVLRRNRIPLRMSL